jgi:hypothetical protein
MLTADLRPPPDFLIIGAKRGGTTSFYFDLLDHPGVVALYPPPVPVLKPIPTKGVHYFDSNATRSARWYVSFMPTSATRRRRERSTGGPVVAGDASPYYLHHPAAASRAHALVPNAKLIALLRNPIDRTYSHWKERRRSNAEPLDFEAALDAEPERLKGERQRLLAETSYVSYPYEQQSYASQSVYVDGLRAWLEQFGRDRLLVVASEDYYRYPNTVLTKVHSFLGLTPLATSKGRVLNEARGSDLDPETRSALAARFAEPNAELERLLGQSFPWD